LPIRPTLIERLFYPMTPTECDQAGRVKPIRSGVPGEVKAVRTAEQTRAGATWGQPGEAVRTDCSRLPMWGEPFGDSLGMPSRDYFISAGQASADGCGQTFSPPRGVSVSSALFRRVGILAAPTTVVVPVGGGPQPKIAHQAPPMAPRLLASRANRLVPCHVATYEAHAKIAIREEAAANSATQPSQTAIKCSRQRDSRPAMTALSPRQRVTGPAAGRLTRRQWIPAQPAVETSKGTVTDTSGWSRTVTW
jgi:hypothetical protein